MENIVGGAIPEVIGNDVKTDVYRTKEDVCPECSNTLFHANACNICMCCGYSECG